MKNFITVILAAACLIGVSCNPPEDMEKTIGQDGQIPPLIADVEEIVFSHDEPEEILQARAEVAALRTALDSAERDLDALLEELAVATERIPAPTWTGGPSFRLNNVEQGTYRLSNDVVVYSEDAKVRLDRSLVYARTGEMQSDPMQTRFRGDLQVEDESGVRQIMEIRIRREGNTVTTQMIEGRKAEQIGGGNE